MVGKLKKYSWNELCEKYKWIDWFDANIVWYVWEKPQEIYKSIRFWFRCNWNKEHFALLKTAFFSYGWDDEFILDLEARQIDKQLRWFKNHKIIVEKQYNRIVWTLTVAKSLVYILTKGQYDLFEYDYKGDNIEESRYKYTGPYVNTRNMKRFLDPQQYKYFESHPNEMKWFLENSTHEIYFAKVKYLYYKTRWYYTEHWWD